MAVKRRAKAGTSKRAAAERRRAFIEAYIQNGRNATDAAITAGFSPRSAYSRGLELVKDREVSAAIDEVLAEREAQSGLTTVNVLREVKRLAMFDSRKLYRDDGTVKRPDEWDDDTAAAVGGFEVEEEYSGTGEDRTLSGYTKKLKIWDKNSALEKAMKHLGLFEKDNAQIRDSLVLNVEVAKPVKR